jgi:hypothetical protein
MRPVETVLRMESREIKENDGGVNMINIRTFANVTVYPQYNNNKKIKNSYLTSKSFLKKAVIFLKTVN